MQYNDPAGGTQSSIGDTQFNESYYQKKALIELVKERYFGALADVTAMPKHFGKKIKRYHYMPMLDERNQNDQGIDAAGVSIAETEYAVQVPDLLNNAFVNVEADETNTVKAYLSGDYVYDSGGDGWWLLIADRAIGSNLATSDTAKVHADIKALIEADTAGATATVDANGVDVDEQALVYTTQAASTIVTGLIAGTIATQRSGNMYGSSKDIGTISSKMPVLSENGGRVNRVGFTRLKLEGTIDKFGFFDEYTQETLDFDTDAELLMHINREMTRGANEITEDALQIDLINGAGVVRYAGAAVTKAEISGVTADLTEVDYDDLSRLSIDLDNNRTPKHTKVIKGSRMIDTRVINGARIMFIGSELIPTVEKMTDHFTKKAFIEVAHYADAGNIMQGEIGTLGSFRIVVVPEMMHWAGVGAVEGVNAGYRTTNGRYDVFPMLVVGDQSFTTIGFQTDGKTVKFKIKHAKPGSDISYALDPYGETGFMSIKWYYGTMILRAERLALLLTAAQV